jgi:chemotaxis-related protein WspB
MLLVLFNLGEERFGIDAAELDAVVSDAPLRPLPGAPHGVVGLLVAEDATIPVVDLGLLTNGRAAAERRSTRILITRCVLYDASMQTVPVGLRVERANDAIQVDPENFEPIGISSPGAPHLGRVIRCEGDLIQQVNVEALLSKELVEILEPSGA